MRANDIDIMHGRHANTHTSGLHEWTDRDVAEHSHNTRLHEGVLELAAITAQQCDAMRSERVVRQSTTSTCEMWIRRKKKRRIERLVM